MFEAKNNWGNSIILIVCMIIVATVFSAGSCTELERKYIRQNKFYQMANWEDRRFADPSLADSLYLGDSDPEIRARAALAIGRIGSDSYNKKLSESFEDSSLIAAEAKFFAAGLIGDSMFFNPIFQAIEAGTPAIPAAVEALGRVADSTQAPRIKVFLNHPDSMVAYQAMLAMFRANEWSDAERMAKIGMATENRKIKYGALFALSRSGRIEASEFFKSTISDTDPEYRMLAYYGLGRSNDTGSLPIIATGLNDSDIRVISSAMASLGRFGLLGLDYIARKLPELNDEKLVTQGVELLGDTLTVKNAGDIIETIFRNDVRENVRAAAAEALLETKGADALFTIDEILSSPTAWQKISIAQGLATIEKNAAMARLATLINDPAPLVRVAALNGLCTIDSAGCDKYINNSLNDDDHVVRVIAIDQAAKRGLTQYASDIMLMYLNNRNSLDDDLKRAIIEACPIFVSDSAYDSLMIAVLEEGCNDEWYFLRDKASIILNEKYEINRRDRIGSYATRIEKKNYKDRFERYDANPTAVIKTSRGEIKIELLYKDAPKTVNNFISLAEEGYYDSLLIHRVVPNFVIQDGCPRRDGWGGPGYTIRCEYTRLTYNTGMVGMAHAGENTGGSQYFITLSPQPRLDGRYTIFGQVISGMDVAHQIVRGDEIHSINIFYGKD